MKVEVIELYDIGGNKFGEKCFLLSVYRIEVRIEFYVVCLLGLVVKGFLSSFLLIMFIFLVLGLSYESVFVG